MVLEKPVSFGMCSQLMKNIFRLAMHIHQASLSLLETIPHRKQHMASAHLSNKKHVVLQSSSQESISVAVILAKLRA